MCSINPNQETLEAMREAERLSHDPNTKRYGDFQEAFDEAMGDETNYLRN